MQFLAARSLWTNLLAFRYDMPSAISPAIWIIFFSGGRTCVVEFWGEWRAQKKTLFSQPQQWTLVTVQHYNMRDGCYVWKCGRKRGTGCVLACMRQFTPLTISVTRDSIWYTAEICVYVRRFAAYFFAQRAQVAFEISTGHQLHNH